MTFSTFIKIIFRKYFRFFVILFICIIIAVVGYLYSGRVSYKNPDTVMNAEAKALVDKVDKLAYLPQDETPTVAKVSNPALLKDQTFFADAKTGDVVLIYSNARKAILYDPVANKIVNISTINVGGVKSSTPTITDIKDKPTAPTDSSGQTQF
ncbi:MAG: hypothetical protein KGL67_01745 [Patescibacteria group bacterium]|nr:hypothetical protein [Patescibacteria group bacterium]